MNDNDFDYGKFIESRFQIVNKNGKLADFKLNKIQRRYCDMDMSGRDIILKARQQGFSSLITAIFTTDFILVPNSYSVICADIEDNAQGLLSKVKKYIEAYEHNTKVKVPLLYNSKIELYNPLMQSTFKIGTAKNTDFGRSKTITNLHLSECAFFPDVQSILLGAGQAVVDSGKFIIETTANGFNEFKELYEDSVKGETTFKALFYKASDFYDQTFLEKKKAELKEKYAQEYPETDTEAFITSGSCYFDKRILAKMLSSVSNPVPFQFDKAVSQ